MDGGHRKSKAEDSGNTEDIQVKPITRRLKKKVTLASKMLFPNHYACDILTVIHMLS